MYLGLRALPLAALAHEHRVIHNCTRAGVAQASTLGTSQSSSARVATSDLAADLTPPDVAPDLELGPSMCRESCRLLAERHAMAARSQKSAAIAIMAWTA